MTPNCATYYGWTMEQWKIAGISHLDWLKAVQGDAAIERRMLRVMDDWCASRVYAPGRSPLVDHEGKPL